MLISEFTSQQPARIIRDFTQPLFGGLFLVLSDTLARTVLAPRQLPVGVVTALLGVPLFLLLLNRARVKQ